MLCIMMSLLWPADVLAVNLKNSSMVSNITIEGGTFSTEFKQGNDTYSVYLEEFQQNLTLNVELNDSRFQYTVEGENALSRDDDNVVYINVVDPNGEYSDENYIINIFFEASGLSYLGSEKGICSPQFDKFHSTYYVILEHDIDTFSAAGIVWNTVDKDATVRVECLDELNEDGTLPEGQRTKYCLTVHENDGTSKKYYIFLYRKASMVSSLDESVLLESIKINGGAVEMQTFSQGRSYYDVMVPPSITQLDIQAYPVDKRNVVEVIGSTIMKENEPIYITIKVSSEENKKESYYTLRCEYDTATHTKKFTKLEILASIFFGLVVGGTAMGCFCLYDQKRRRGKRS